MKRGLFQKIQDLRYIFARNVLVLTNGIVSVVCVLLYTFGDTNASLFLGGVLFLNMALGLGQDIRSWLKLEQLQLLTAPHVLRVTEKGEESVLIEEITKEDHIKLRTGDQVACDGTLLEAQGLELNEGLITGESTIFPRKVGERVLAGSIIAAGTGLMESENVFRESRMARMTEGVKTYAANQSPIQRDVALVIRYAGYLLFVILAYVIVHGNVAHVSTLEIVKNIGAITSIIVPQGLAFAMTLLFAYGAGHLFNRNVLLQEVNATEKLGRIRNLCMDKTGTLTENTLTVEAMYCRDISEERARTLMAGYLKGSGDSSQTMVAVASFVGDSFSGTIEDTLSFSSWRAYGAVSLAVATGDSAVVLVGAPETFLSHMKDKGHHAWLSELVARETKKGKRLLALATVKGNEMPRTFEGVEIIPRAVFALSAKLRPGIREAIDFFQKRGVRLRIISGDNPDTVRSVAEASGVLFSNKWTTGAEMAKWSEADFDRRAKDCTIFARTSPEQKEKLIESLKLDGFTAMVGDGANDALAIKKADLGIAMFDGAPATRQLASVVLTNNSFTALPGGVELADSIIKNAELFAGLFFSSALLGLFFFILLAIAGYPYQLTPLNVTLINYFVVGLPGILVSYWTIFPTQKLTSPSDGRFLSRVAPLAIWSAVAQTALVWAFFLKSPEALRSGNGNSFVVIAFGLIGIIFFLIVPRVYRGTLTRRETIELWLFCLFELVVLVAVFYIPIVSQFFEISRTGLSFAFAPFVVGTVLLYALVQFVIARMIERRRFTHRAS